MTPVSAAKLLGSVVYGKNYFVKSGRLGGVLVGLEGIGGVRGIGVTSVGPHPVAGLRPGVGRVDEGM